MEEGANAENRSAKTEEHEVPFAANEVTDVDQKLSRRGKFRPKVFEDFAEDRHYSNNQEGGDRECDANDDDRVSHCRLNFLSQTRTRFEETGEPFQNLG